MRVTKAIREYVEENVSKIYQQYFDELQVRYDELDRELKNATNDVNSIVEEARNKIADMLKNKYPQVDGKWRGYYTGTESHVPTDETRRLNLTYGSLYNTAPRTELDKLKEKTKNERDAKIKDIIVTLELGGNKEDLDRMLNDIQQ